MNATSAVSLCTALALALNMPPRTAAAQQVPEQGGIELGLSMSRFPAWHLTTHFTNGITSH